VRFVGRLSIWLYAPIRGLGGNRKPTRAGRLVKSVENRKQAENVQAEQKHRYPPHPPLTNRSAMSLKIRGNWKSEGCYPTMCMKRKIVRPKTLKSAGLFSTG
jgi:ribosomal protein S30